MIADLAALFVQRDRQAAALAATDALLADVGASYSRSQGYRVNLRVEQLRFAVTAAGLFSTAQDGPTQEAQLPVYKTTIPGAKPVYLRGPTRAQALDTLITTESLSGDDFADAVEDGAKIFKDGDLIEVEKPAITTDQNAGGSPPAADKGATK